MLSFSRRKRRNRDFRYLAQGVWPPAATSLYVVGVRRTSLFDVDFSFSAPVTSIGGAGNEQVVVTTASGQETPSMAQQISPTTVRFRLDGGTVLAGDPWEILTAPDGLDFHGLTFVVPQAGLVT